jgi:aryl sulfotransferase
MAKLIRPAARSVRTRVFDSARWDAYQPRDSDIVVATYSKCGTTWMQRIVSMLVFASAEPRPIWDLSPWPDARFGPPIDLVYGLAESQTHRRFFKSHLPLDALPFYEDVKYLHVARDGRDACMSLHNHLLNLTPEARAMLSEISLNDPKFGDPYPEAPEDAGAFFHSWVTSDDERQGDPSASFFHVERTYWQERKRPNVLLVHYNDLKADREGEMRRIAEFLDIEIAEALWPQLADAASFESMKRDGDSLLARAHDLWEGGPNRFLNKGTNGRWHDCVAAEDLARYQAKVAAEVSPTLARWLEHGRRVAGDPRTLPD